MANCPHCGKQVAEESQFCWNCGLSVREIPTGASALQGRPGTIHCTDCGAEVISSSRFCHRCGRPLRTLDVEASERSSGYPIHLAVDYPERLSRGLIFIKWLLVIPHLVVVWALGVASLIVTVIAFLVTLITGRYPRSLFDFNTRVWRWSANVVAYVLLLRDDYPPFSWKPEKYPVTFEVEYPQEFVRWAPLYQWLLVIPSAFVANALLYGMLLALIPGWFIILVVGRLPRPLFDLVAGAGRWYVRTYLYAGFMTNEYPPWTMETSPGATRLGWVVAPIGAVAWIGLNVATAFSPGSEGTSLPDLQVGDCIQYGATDPVREVSCTGAYDAEVVSVAQVPGPEYPGEASFLSLWEELCPSEANNFLYPLREDWAAGDRTLICLME